MFTHGLGPAAVWWVLNAVGGTIAFGGFLPWIADNFSAFMDIANGDDASVSAPPAYAFVLFVVGAIFSIVVWLATVRWVVDFYDTDTAGDPQPATMAAVKQGFDAIWSRFFPSIGWYSLYWIGFMVFWVLFGIGVGISAAVGGGFGVAILVALVLAFAAFAIWVAVVTGFVDIAVVDRPGNPYSESARVAKHHFWTVAGILILTAIVSGIGTSLGGWVSSSSSDAVQFFVDLSGVIVSALATTLALVVSAGARVFMYRAVNPEPKS